MSKAALKNTPRFLKLYREEIVPKLSKSLNCPNTLAIPRILKISINMGIGEATSNSKIVEQAAIELGQITGQKPKICRARKPISNFKLRKDLPIGCCVTLRRTMMYEFLDRLINIAIPRIRDFRGFSINSFDIV